MQILTDYNPEPFIQPLLDKHNANAKIRMYENQETYKKANLLNAE